MGAITLDNIAIEGITGLQVIEDIAINVEPNKHGTASITALVADEYEEITKQFGENTLVVVKTRAEQEILFKGYVSQYNVRKNNQLAYLDIVLITTSHKMDSVKRTRSFQKPSMTYDQIFQEIEKKYSYISIINNSSKNQCIGRTIFQYEESDFEFLIRLASELNTSVIAGTGLDWNILTVGMPDARKTAQNKSSQYEYCISEKYQELGDKGLYPELYSYYKVNSYDNLQIGDIVEIEKTSLRVICKRAALVKSEVIFTYQIATEILLSQKRIENKKLSGLAFKGTVDDVEQDTVTVNLDIDKHYGKQELQAYDWKPITANLLYAMPEEKTTVIIQNNDFSGYDISATACLRTNGNECMDTKIPAEKVFMVPSGKKLNLGKEQVSVSIQDAKIQMSDDNEVLIQAKVGTEVKGIKNISVITYRLNMISPLMIEMFGEEMTQLIINQSIDGNASSMVEGGTVIKTYQPFNDAPSEVEMSYNWKKLGEKLLWALALVAAAAAIAALAAFCFMGGPAALFIGGTVLKAAAFKAAEAAIAVGVAALAGGLISGGITYISNHSDTDENRWYKALDSFCNGAILSSALATAAPNVLGEAGACYLVALYSLGYQSLDDYLDDKYGNDFDDTDVSELDVIMTTVIDTFCAFCGNRLNNKVQSKLTDWVADLQQKGIKFSSKHYFEAVDILNRIPFLKSFPEAEEGVAAHNIARANIGDLRTYLFTLSDKLGNWGIRFLSKNVAAVANVVTGFEGTALNDVYDTVTEDNEMESESVSFYFDDNGTLILK
ncbi:MAG: hypothetical protein MR531_04760 [Lachnospiraceae bacterium]|nr:hypothetical protein [Lachnospiraceae bacterium]